MVKRLASEVLVHLVKLCDGRGTFISTCDILPAVEDNVLWVGVVVSVLAMLWKSDARMEECRAEDVFFLILICLSSQRTGSIAFEIKCLRSCQLLHQLWQHGRPTLCIFHHDKA